MSNVYDSVIADSVEVGDLVIINGNRCEIMDIHDGYYTDDNITFTVHSFDTGDVEDVSVIYSDYIDLWTE